MIQSCKMFTLFLLASMTLVNASRTLLETDQGLPSSASNDWIQTIRTDATTAIPLIVHLKHTKKQLQKLEEMFNAVSDPDNKAYGNHLTQDEVTSIVNHPEDKLQSVVQWLRTGGATNIIINKHRDSIKFSAKAKDVEVLFDTEMYAYKHATRDVTLHRAALEYSVPETIASSVTLVSGLLRLPNLERFSGFLSESQSQSEQNTTWPKDCKGCNNRVTPGVLAARYSFPSPTVDDAPSTLSISEFQGQVWDQSDLNKFSTSCAIPFNITVDHENGTIAPGKACKIPIFGTQFCGEALLDIEYAKAIAGPTVELTDIYQSSYNLLNWATDVENIDDANLIGVHSVSYGNDETQQTSVAFMNSCNAAFMKIGVRGVSILFASGDQGVCGRSGCGYKNGRFHPDFPSSSPYITSVGGTDFVTKNVIGDEKAWVSGGGGFSDTFPIPAYQTDAVAKYKSSSDANLPPSAMFNNTGRGYPDVAALAGQQNPYCIGAASMLIGIAGTSAATPVTAAIFARLNGVRVKNGGKNLGFLNPWIYKNAAAFNDVKQGCNSDNSKHGFTAIAGWDAATGVGTPNYSEMVKVL